MAGEPRQSVSAPAAARSRKGCDTTRQLPDSLRHSQWQHRDMRKLPLAFVAVLLAAAASAAVAANRPHTISLPNGFMPEGIASQGSRLYVGSLRSGAVWTGNAKGRGKRVLVPGQNGRSVAGLKVSGNRIFAAGAGSKAIYLFDRRSGRDLRVFQIPDAGFINDVALRGRNAYFTESAQGKQVFYVIRRSGRGSVRTVPVTGDLVYQTGINANGIVAAGRRLITVTTNTGGLFTLNPRTGASKRIVLRGHATDVKNGDGLLRRGRILYVVENQSNRIAVVRLSRDLSRGTITRYITEADFDIPTTITPAGRDLWVVNSRFNPQAPPTTRYDIVRVTAARARRQSGADNTTAPGNKGGQGQGQSQGNPLYPGAR
jgi:hypothetical protein